MTPDGFAALARRALRSPSPGAVRVSAIPRPLVPVWAHALVPLVLAGVWALAIRNIRAAAMSDLGLISVLPPSVLLLLCLLTVSFCLSLRHRPLNPVVSLSHVVALVVLLYGITSFVEPEPRVGAVYIHVGVMNYIAHYGSVNPKIDAYFNWPGFFALGALIAKAAGFHSAMAFAQWGPIVYNLLFLAPLVVIFRWASDDPRVTWLGLWVFYSTNWVAQDHISPQATGFLLWLAILAALLTWFIPRPAALKSELSYRRVFGLLDPRPLIARFMTVSEGAANPRPVAQRAGLLLMIVAIYAAAVTGHQLTPIPALLTVAGLVVFARLEPRSLPIIMALVLAAWISYMTTNYLEGNYRTLAAPVGRISQNLGQSVTGRFAGSPQHQLIVDLRVVGSALIWLLAAAGFARRLRAGRADIGMAVVAAAPFLLPALQPYGGEILLRVFLFSLPAVSFGIASFAFPSSRAGFTWPTVALATLVGCGFLGLFQFMRYGNERLDNFTAGDAAVVHAFYRVAPAGSTVFAGDDNLPWRYQDYNSYDYRLVTDLYGWRASRPDPTRLAQQLELTLDEHGGGYVIVTRSTEIAAGLLDGKPGVLEALVRLLRASPQAHETYSNSDGELFYLRRRRAPRESPTSRGPAPPSR